MKRMLLLLCILVLACTLSFVVFAADDNAATSDYVVTIPDSVEFDSNGTGSFTVELSESLSNKQTIITLTGNSYDNGYWYLTHTQDDNIKLQYTISDSTTQYGNNDAILDVSNPTVFEYKYQIQCVNNPTVAGNYTDVITLSIDVESLIPVNGQTYANGDYIYTYSESAAGWSVALNEAVATKTQTTYSAILDNVQGFPVVDMTSTFQNCTKMTSVPGIPSTVTNLTNTFSGCTSLTGTITLDVNPTTYTSVFRGVNFRTQKLKLNGTSTSLDDMGSTGTNYCAQCNGHCDYYPLNATYYVGVTSTTPGDYHSATAVYTRGDTLPSAKAGDVYVEGDYEYRYQREYDGSKWVSATGGVGYGTGWGVCVRNKTQASYGTILSQINNRNVTCLNYTFADRLIKQAPQIPNTIQEMNYTFSGARYLESAPTLPDSLREMNGTFKDCYLGLTTYEGSTASAGDFSGYKIPALVNTANEIFNNCDLITHAPDFTQCTQLKYMSSAFRHCKNLIVGPELPDSVTSLYYAFSQCDNLQVAPKLPASLTDARCTFMMCYSLESAPVLPEGLTNAGSMFTDCTALKTYHGATTATFDGYVIPSSITNASGMFHKCTSISGSIYIYATTKPTSGAFTYIDFNAQNVWLIPVNNNDSVVDVYGASNSTYCKTCNGKCNGTDTH